MKKRHWLFIMAALVLVVFSNSWAAEKLKVEEVVVTASKIQEPLTETTSDVVVIKREWMESRGVGLLPEALRQVPELNVVQNGGKGTLAHALLRGGASAHTLVLVDGIRANSTLDGGFDFSGVSAADIERIEIVKGPQSTAYGSEAATGVINIITKRGVGKPRLDASFETGSFKTYSPSVTLSGGWRRLDYRLTASYIETEGFSAAKSGVEKDGYENTSFSGKIGFKVKENSDIEVTTGYSKGKTSLDGFDYLTGTAVDDENYVQKKENYMASVRGRTFLSPVYEQVLTVSTQKDTLKGEDPDTPFNNYELLTGRETVDWQHNVYSDAGVLTAGAEYRQDKGENKDVFDETVENKALYLAAKSKMEGLTLNGGVRRDMHETAGDKTTWRIGATEYRKDSGLTFRVSYGTAFRAPSFNELFYPGYGNVDLKPEESTSWEIGMEKAMGRTALTAIYFDQEYENLIETDPATWTAKNISKADIKGVETGLTYLLFEGLVLKGGYTYLDTENRDTGKRLPRRPMDKVNAGASYAKGGFTLLADYIYVGDRPDVGDQTLDAYAVVNLSGAIALTKGLSISARVENLLEEDYEEARGYGTPGRSFYGGLKASF